MEQFKSDLVQCYTRAGSKVSTCVTVLKKSIGGHTKTKTKVQLRMDNQETLTPLGTQDTERRQRDNQEWTIKRH